jgi:Ca2+-transporting ATPase
MAIRSERESLFSQGLLSNMVMLWCIAATVILQLVTVYVPVLNPVFKTQPLSIQELAAVIGLSSLVFLAAEMEKRMKRRTAGRRS